MIIAVVSIEMLVKYLIFSIFFFYARAQGSSGCTDGKVRLYNTITQVAGEGAVQICYNDTWYAVCDYSWGCADGNVVCRELGYSAGAGSTVYSSNYYFGYWSNVRPYYYACSGYESSLSSCNSYHVYYYYYCNYNDAAGVRCITSGANGTACSPNGSVRLVNGTRTEGRVEYCYNGQWSAICSSYYNFNDEEATVACKQLGFAPYGSIVSSYKYRCANGNCGNGFISYISCSYYATESSLESCTITPMTSYSYSCSSCSNPAAIRCYDLDNCTNGDIRLVNGSIDQEGRIEICANGVWGGICSSYGWDESDAFVICKQLGYADTVPDISRSYLYGTGDTPMVYGHLNCHGYEKSISECTMLEYLHFTCYSSYPAGVLCTDGCIENALRLVGGKTELDGTVEVCVNHIWGLIGDGSWDEADADVVCRQLGLPNGGAIPILNAHKTDRVTVHYSYVLCDGNELLLDNCHKLSLPLEDGNAAYEEATVAGVVCAEATGPPRHTKCQPKETAVPNPTGCTNGKVRFMDDHETLQYCYNGHWTGFCTMTHHEAMVACKQLGYTKYTWGLVYDNYQNVDPTKNVTSLFQNITCSGSEDNLKQCTVHEGDCLTQCPIYIGLKCFNPTSCGGGAVRLSGGDIEQEGRVEVCVNGVWGSICDFGWDKTDAHIICKQLGYAELEPMAYIGSTFGEAKGPVIYSDVQCEGWQNNLRDCKKLQYENVTCPHYTVAGVMCSNGCTQGKLRLVNGQSKNDGIIEICYDDLWGLISDSEWDDNDAQVVCRQLGYNNSGSALTSATSHYSKPNKTIHIGNVGCHGNEANLHLCVMTIYSLEEGKHLQQDVAGVSCVAQPSSTSIAATSTSSAATQHEASTSPLLLAILVIVCVMSVFVFACVGAFVLFIIKNRRQKSSSTDGGRHLPSVVMSKTYHHDDDDDNMDIHDQRKLLFKEDDDEKDITDADDEILT